MIFGIGIDMIEVERVEHKITKDSGFREFVFTGKEIEYCESKTHKYEHYAACFAAKEAFLKALGTGWTNGLAFNEIEISHDAGGKPHMNVLGATREKVSESGTFDISVSLTHLKNIAASVVVLEIKK